MQSDGSSKEGLSMREHLIAVILIVCMFPVFLDDVFQRCMDSVKPTKKVHVSSNDKLQV